MAPVNAPDLCEAIREAALLDSPRQNALAHELLPRFADLKGLANELLRRGWLTPFQLNKLAAGRADQLLLGPYVLLGLIGEGGMGKVFKAEHRRLKRLAALKVIKPEYLTAPGALTSFQREAEAAARLDHPNIVRIYDANEADGTHFIAMEYIDGTDLAHLVKKRGRLSVAAACNYARQVALGLEHAHTRGLIHRDIKPSNLLLAGETGVVKILDLGIARLTRPDGTGQTTNAAGLVVGTPDFVAPEQARNPCDVDFRADLYSLGCSLYYFLIGRPPFQGVSSVETLLQHVLDEPPTVEELRSDLPPGLSGVVQKLMAKRVQDRFSTAAEVVAALGPYAEQDTGIDWAAATGIDAALPEASDVALGMTPHSTARLSGSRVRPVLPLSLTIANPTEAPPSSTPRRPPDWRRRVAVLLFVISVMSIAGGITCLFMIPVAPAPESKNTPPSPTAALPATDVRPASSIPATPPGTLERQAARKILEAGGRLVVQAPADGPQPFPVLPNNTLPKTAFHVTEVNFSDNPRITDAVLETLNDLTGLRSLNLSGTKVNGSFLKSLQHTTELQTINLRNSDVTDGALERLGAFSNLRVVNLGKTGITDGGARSLSRLRKLKELYLDDTTVDDRALEALANSPELETIHLDGSRVTDAGLEQLTRFRHLRSVTLDNLPITDDGLKYLEKLSLDHLRLNSTLVSDKGIKSLRVQIHLRTLGVRRTAITPEGIVELRKQLPNCQIERDTKDKDQLPVKPR
jgi:serine/threonine-protein kinase